MTKSRRSRKPGPQASRRPKNRREVLDRYLVVTEGAVTEPGYFTQLNSLLKSHPSANLLLDVKPKISRGKPKGDWKSDPKSVVEFCIRERDTFQEKVKSGTNSKDLTPYKACFAVVDVDEWDNQSSGKSNLRKAIELAAQNNIYLIISNLKFEVWLLWHCLETIDFTQDQLDQRCKSKKILHGKNISGDFPYQNYRQAINRCLKKETIDHGIKGNYPSSAMPVFFQKLGI